GGDRRARHAHRTAGIGNRCGRSGLDAARTPYCRGPTGTAHVTGEHAVMDARSAEPAMRRALGPLAPYLLHLRPAEWPIVFAHASVGWLLARGIAVPDQPYILGMIAWVVALNGGTLALNSAFDRDEGDIAYLRNPPTPPRGLVAFALALMFTGA